MLSRPAWFTLEVKYVDRMATFYEAFLELDVVEETDDEAVLAAGDTDIRLRAPGGVPRGGLHTHYALTVPERAYDGWHERLSERFDLVEHSFGNARSLYFYDPEGNCVELREHPTDGDGTGVAGLFELVLEVEQLYLAVEFYERLGFEMVDDGRQAGRVQLSNGSFDIELWESRLGIADARGGVHVDFGIHGEDIEAIAADAEDAAQSVTNVDDGIRIRDPDGHRVTLVEE
jgi:catechol-2,3-dioxygenase